MNSDLKDSELLVQAVGGGDCPARHVFAGKRGRSEAFQSKLIFPMGFH